jgi:Golgi apparatus protein 1
MQGPAPALPQAASDIRLSMRLFKSCVNDQRKFCADVEPGHMRVQVGTSKY